MEIEQFADEYKIHLLLGEGGQAKYILPHLVSILAARTTTSTHSKFIYQVAVKKKLSRYKWISSPN
jgi:hypothetical protein